MCKALYLFDIDGTLCKSSSPCDIKILTLLSKFENIGDLALVGGGTYSKLCHQFGQSINLFKYIFAENGSQGYYQTASGNFIQFYKKELRSIWSSKTLSSINRILLNELISMDLPIRTGNFIDLRSGLIYFVPIGHACNSVDREEFKRLDEQMKIRQKLLLRLTDKLPECDCSLGGELGINIIPPGWNKSQIIEHIPNDYTQITFFGDKIYPGGNDYPLAIMPQIDIAVSVNNPQDTYDYLLQIISENNCP